VNAGADRATHDHDVGEAAVRHLFLPLFVLR
jgi:hypothetical protein